MIKIKRDDAAKIIRNQARESGLTFIKKENRFLFIDRKTKKDILNFSTFWRAFAYVMDGQLSYYIPAKQKFFLPLFDRKISKDRGKI